MAEPPVLAGAVKLIVAWPTAPIADTFGGADASPMGVKLVEALDAALLPMAFSALTLQVYAVPLARPFTTIGLALAEPLLVPGLHAAAYPVMADPPVLEGAVNAIDADPSLGVAVPIAGAGGLVA